MSNPHDDKSTNFEALFGVGAAPVEPNHNLRHAAKVTFELYSAFLQEGFSEAQSLDLCKEVLRAQLSGGSQ